MAKIQKETNLLRLAFAKLVEACGGSLEVKNLKGRTRVNYRVKDKKAYFIWHSSISDINALRSIKRHLYQIAEQLGISHEISAEYIQLIARVDHIEAWYEWVSSSERIFSEIEKIFSEISR